MTVPRPLQEQLGEAATDSLVGMFEQLEASRQQQQENHKDQLFELLEERFLRHVAESEGRLRGEIADSEARLRGEIAESEGRLRGEIAESETRLRGEIAESEARLRTEVAELRAEMQAGFNRQQDQLARQQEQIADVHKQIALQTRWILAALGVAAVLFPIIQRVMEVLLQ